MKIKVASLIVAVVLLTVTSQAQTVTTVAQLTSETSQLDRLTQGRDGLLYGTTLQTGPLRDGAVVKVDISTGAVTRIVVFNGTNGAFPWGGVTLGSDGFFYGTTLSGGQFGFGVIYKTTPNGHQTVLHSFAGGTTDGSCPLGAPIQAADGSFYGAAFSITGGLVYKVTSAGEYSVIYYSDGTTGIGQSPVQATDGTLNFASAAGGANGGGSALQLTTSGTVQATYSFASSLGFRGASNLIQGTDGNFYGALFNSSQITGTLFQLSKKLTQFQTLHSFSYPGTCQGPSAVTQGNDGNLYGVDEGSDQSPTASPSLYQLSTTGNFVTLYTFPVPYAYSSSLLQNSNGKFYGTTTAFFRYASVYQLDDGLAPFVALVTPIGKAGQGIGILGQGFTGTTSVKFNGVGASSFQVVSDTYINAIAPTGVTTGSVQVTTPTGILTSNKNFTVKSH